MAKREEASGHGVPRPMQLQGDAAEAIDLLQAGKLLSAQLWAAHVSALTGMHTYETFHKADGSIAGFGSTLQFEMRQGGGDRGLCKTGERLNYFRPSEIARRIKRSWDRPGAVLGGNAFISVVMLLESKQEREFALEAAGLLARDLPDLEESRIAEIHREIAQLGIAKSLAAAQSRPALTEPPEVFQAVLDGLGASPVAEFFGERSGG